MSILSIEKMHNLLGCDVAVRAGTKHCKRPSAPTQSAESPGSTRPSVGPISSETFCSKTVESMSRFPLKNWISPSHDVRQQ